MNYGEKIVALRKEKGMTQTDLGSALNVTFQAVSKWERDEAQPDFETIVRMSKLFGVPLEYFTDGEQVQPSVETEKSEMIGVCKECGKALHSGEEYSTTPYIICKACAKRKEDEAKAKKIAEEREKKQAIERERARAQARLQAFRKKRNAGLWWTALATAGVLLVYALIAKNFMGVGALIGSIFGVGAVSFIFISQLIWGGVVLDIVECGGKVIGTPGVIFTLDLDGLLFLAGVKILFAIIRFIVWLTTVLFFGAIGIIVSPFTFVPRLIQLSKGIDNDEDYYNEKVGEVW